VERTGAGTSSLIWTVDRWNELMMHFTLKLLNSYLDGIEVLR
jgi:hypothetical protein